MHSMIARMIMMNMTMITIMIIILSRKLNVNNDNRCLYLISLVKKNLKKTPLTNNNHRTVIHGQTIRSVHKFSSSKPKKAKKEDSFLF